MPQKPPPLYNALQAWLRQVCPWTHQGHSIGRRPSRASFAHRLASATPHQCNWLGLAQGCSHQWMASDSTRWFSLSSRPRAGDGFAQAVSGTDLSLGIPSSSPRPSPLLLSCLELQFAQSHTEQRTEGINHQYIYGFPLPDLPPKSFVSQPGL